MQSPTRKAASKAAARGRSIEGCCRLLKAAAKAAVILRHSGLAHAICYAPVVHYRHPASTSVCQSSASSVLSFHIERVEFNLVQSKN